MIVQFSGLLRITSLIFDCSVLVSWAIENNLVYFWGIIVGL